MSLTSSSASIFARRKRMKTSRLLCVTSRSPQTASIRLSRGTTRPGCAHQALQNRELRSRKRDLAPSSPGLSRAEIEHEVGKSQALLRASQSACAHPNAREQHIEGERFGQVIVGARIQPANDVLGSISCGQQQDRSLDILASQASRHLQPVHEWQHDIQDDDVERVELRGAQPGRAVMAHGDGAALLFELPGGVFRHFTIIFNEQDLHCSHDDTGR